MKPEASWQRLHFTFVWKLHRLQLRARVTLGTEFVSCDIHDHVLAFVLA